METFGKKLQNCARSCMKGDRFCLQDRKRDFERSLGFTSRHFFFDDLMIAQRTFFRVALGQKKIVNTYIIYEMAYKSCFHISIFNTFKFEYLENNFLGAYSTLYNTQLKIEAYRRQICIFIFSPSSHGSVLKKQLSCGNT